MVPVSGFHRGDKTGNAGAVLRDSHRYLSGGARVAVADQSAIGFVRYIPECNPGFGEKIGDRHEGRADNAEGMLDAMHLQDLDEGLFSGHFHRRLSFVNAGVVVNVLPGTKRISFRQ